MTAPSRVTKRIAHRTGIAGAVVWWLYAFYSTGLFTGFTWVGILVYLLGLVVVYVLAYYLVVGAAWALSNF